MKSTELAADICNRSKELLKTTLADFSDADMLARPCAGANHTAWQLGHLIAAETGIVNTCTPGAALELPAGFAEKFNKSTAASDDATFFPKKADLLAQFEKTRAGTIAWIRKLSEEDLNKAIEGRMAAFIPTVHHAIAIFPNHTAMHVGQFQVIRRKLGKPVLF